MTQEYCQTSKFSVFLALWNTNQNYRTPSIHFYIADWLQESWERGKTRLLLQAFRASGKSTIVGLFVAWLLTRDPDLRILVLSAEANLSAKMVRTIRKIIERHPLTAGLRPNRADDWSADSFTVKRKRVSRDPSVLARSLFANITGSRADVIICDDVEVPNTCDTVGKRETLRERLSENQFILVPGGTQLYIGTPHSYYSIYATNPREEIGEVREFLHGYERKTIPLLNEAGDSAWPDRYSMEDIEQYKRESGPAKFSSQMMLEPMNILDGRLDLKKLRRYSGELIYEEVQQEATLRIGSRRLVSASAWWDPAFGKPGGDKSVLAVVYTDEEGEYWLHRVVYIAVCGDEDEATLQCRCVAEVCMNLYIPTIYLETNGIGGFLPSILRREIGNMKSFSVVSEQVSSKNKAQRILDQFDVVMAANALHVHDSVYETRFMQEMQEWRPGLTSAKDDGLDAVAGALSMEPVRLKRSYGKGFRPWKPIPGLHTAQTDFHV